MITLGFDLRALQYGFKAHKNRGIGVYARNLIQRRRLAPAGLSIIGLHDSHYEAHEPLEHNSTPYRPVRVPFPRGIVKDYIWQNVIFRLSAQASVKNSEVDMIFFPSHLDTPPWLRVPYVVCAHDMIQAALKNQLYNSLKHRLDIARQVSALRGAVVITAVSEHTKKDVIRFANVDPDKVHVISQGVDADFRPGVTGGLARFDLPEKFILNVGGIDWRKNMNLLFDSFSALVKQYPEYHLVITGDIESDPQYIRFTSSLKEKSLEPRVHAVGYVTHQELVSLYNRAEVFFYPSLYEGFGLPVLEAMACGTPVISTNRSSIPEVAGKAACLLDPDEPESFTQALISLVESDAEKARLSKAGIDRAAGFSWDRCATETYKALVSALA